MPLIIALLMFISLAGGKIVITASGPDSESKVDTRFGRAGWYLIYDPADGTWEPIDNSVAPVGSAGRDAAKTLVSKGVKVVITGQCGSKAMTILRSAKIRVFHNSGSTVAKALEDYEAGLLKEIK